MKAQEILKMIHNEKAYKGSNNAPEGMMPAFLARVKYTMPQMVLVAIEEALDQGLTFDVVYSAFHGDYMITYFLLTRDRYVYENTRDGVLT